MRGLSLLIATILTFGYGFAAQAAMTVDRAETIRRAHTIATEAALGDANRIWYGGMLAPVTVEVSRPEAKPVKLKVRTNS